MDGLNESQRAAVVHTEGPLLVLAGAGSGKTRVITHRVAHLLDLGILPTAIVALSFTNKAAGEMRTRLRRMVGSVADELVLGTFHSVGVKIMREDPGAFGLPQKFTILDQGDVYGLIRSLLYEFGVHASGNDRRFDLGAIVSRISLGKNAFADASDLSREAKTEYDETAAALLQPYQRRLQNLGAVDFDDLVCRVVTSLRTNPELKSAWRSRIQYLLVDEYQDTNPAQFAFIRELLGAHDNLCVVGDDDQAIYGWRGADVRNILEFERAFPRARVVKLEHNYRSRPAILAVANAVIVHNSDRHQKILRPTRAEGEPVSQVVCDDGDSENRWVADKIRELVTDGRVALHEIAVLYRSSRQSRAVEQRLQEHGLKLRVLGGQAFYDKKEVKDVMAYLRVLVTPRDELAVRRALDTPSRGIGDRSVDALTEFSRQHRISLLDAIHRSGENSEIAAKPARALAEFSRQIREAESSALESRSVVAPLRAWIERAGLREAIRRETGSDAATSARWAGVEWLLQSVARFEASSHTAGRGRWSDYLGGLTLARAGDEESDQGRITLATLHSAKGLEWSHVFLIGCEEGTLPHRRVAAPRASDAIAGDLGEERRLFYVGVTRARDRLWLTRAKVRSERGVSTPMTPSRFLVEVPPEFLHLHDAAQDDILTREHMQSLADAFLQKMGRSEA